MKDTTRLRLNTLVGGAKYGARRAARTLSRPRVGGFIVALLLCMVSISATPVYAEGSSCFSQYEQTLNTNWNTYTTCIADAIQMGGVSGYLSRKLCEAEFISNALEAEAEYLVCMSLLPFIQ